MSDPALLHALKAALDADPSNGRLWLHYAELLEGAGRVEDAIAALRKACERAETRSAATCKLAGHLLEAGQVAEALIRVEAALAAHADHAELHAMHAKILRARGEEQDAGEAQERSRLLGSEPPVSAPRDEEGRALASVTPEASDPDEWASHFEWGDLRVGFADVAGLDDIKRQINLRIIAPFSKPEIYQAFGREGGGGVLLYGPPGCGKTYIARATAGECGARFVCVNIHDVVDKFWGESEKLVHALFEDARRRAPTVLFFDEFDALGGTRGRSESQFWKTLVDQLLQEMDGIVGRNRDVLLFAATNAPWSVDSAFRRPGRFDRVLFVPPPDEPAREAILARHIARLPGGERIDARKLAKATGLFTGADLKSLCERAAEDALDRSLASGKIHPVTDADFKRELGKMSSSAQEWLATARNYARYSNEGGQYDELAEFLRRVKRW